MGAGRRTTPEISGNMLPQGAVHRPAPTSSTGCQNPLHRAVLDGFHRLYLILVASNVEDPDDREHDSNGQPNVVWFLEE